MFSKVSGGAALFLQGSSMPCVARSSAFVARRVLLPSGPLPVTSSRSGAASALSRSLAGPPPASFIHRDWPSARDGWYGTAPHATAGGIARQASLDAPASPAEIDFARQAHAQRTGEGVDPGLATATIQVSMNMALERSREEALKGDGPGVVEGLRGLAIGAGDAVAEQAPERAALPVCMAMEGVTFFVALPDPLRLRDYNAELERFREGHTRGIRTLGLDLKPLRPPQHFIEGAQAVSRQLTAVPGSGFEKLPKDTRFKALISRGVFDYLDRHEIDASVRDAGRLLQPGGGLVFDFSHAAGRPVPAEAGVQRNRLCFQDIEDAVHGAGLGLRSLYVTFRFADDPGQKVIPTRRVVADATGRIDLRKADAAAWSGWNEIFFRHDKHGRPVHIDVSGVFVKDGPPEK